VFPIFPVDYPFYRIGALFYHGLFEASNNKTIDLAILKQAHNIAWLLGIGTAAFGLFRSSNSRAASSKDHSGECSEVAAENVTQAINSGIQLRKSQ
jgi:hypothetical protein